MTDDQAERRRAFADMVVQRAFAIMSEEGVPHDMAVDRMLTLTALVVGTAHGKEAAARGFREMASNIDRGALDFFLDTQATTAH